VSTNIKNEYFSYKIAFNVEMLFFMEACFMEFFDDFAWHSSIGIDEGIEYKKFFTKLPNNKKAMSMFIASADKKLLIHKTTQALWRVSEDGSSIEPVFDTDVLTEDELDNIV
jgi:hypothetical protein